MGLAPPLHPDTPSHIARVTLDVHVSRCVRCQHALKHEGSPLVYKPVERCFPGKRLLATFRRLRKVQIRRLNRAGWPISEK